MTQSDIWQHYDSQQIRSFLFSLEQKYPVSMAQNAYQHLVNFSANQAVPYHQWFKYREGFAGELIRHLLRRSGAQKEEIIVDPFCGSGTTNVVSWLEGYSTLGLDVNPMSAFLTNSKIDHYTGEDLCTAENFLREFAFFRELEWGGKYTELEKYFQPQLFRQLLRIREYLNALPECKGKNILTVAFLAILEDCSDRKRDGNGLRKSPTNIEDAIEYFGQKTCQILKDIQHTVPITGATGYGVYDTAFHLCEQVEDHYSGLPVGAIIFSPPYPNSFDYFESYKLELVLGNFVNSIQEIGALRKKAIRSFVGVEEQQHCDLYIDEIAREIEKVIPLKEKETGKKDARTRKVPDMLRGYFVDMRQVLAQCAQSLAAGKRTYIVIDQSAYMGKVVPTDLLLAYLGEQVGFQVGEIMVCKTARTSTQQLIKYPYLKNQLRGSIVELIKK